MERKEVLWFMTSLDTYKEYSIPELEDACREAIKKTLTYTSQWINNIIPPVVENVAGYKIKAESDYDSTVFTLNVYRLETEAEAIAREEKEERVRIANAKQQEKRKQTLARIKKERELREAALLKDPEYVKFIESQKKFK